MTINRRANRLTSEARPACIKPSTWALIQGAHARRKSQLAGKGNSLKARSIAKYLWSVKDEAGPDVKIAGPAPLSIPQTMWLAACGR